MSRAKDTVVGIAACGLTPFVHGALKRARQLGAATIFVTCAPEAVKSIPADIIINPVVGPEVITGSTRMKAGTATKLVLNTLTTAAMIRMGKVYGNLMVDLKATNRKLRDRSDADGHGSDRPVEAPDQGPPRARRWSGQTRHRHALSPGGPAAGGGPSWTNATSRCARP